MQAAEHGATANLDTVKGYSWNRGSRRYLSELPSQKCEAEQQRLGRGPWDVHRGHQNRTSSFGRKWNMEMSRHGLSIGSLQLNGLGKNYGRAELF